MVRSRVAHGVIKAIDTSAARKMPGVLAVYTGADLAAYGTLKCIVPFKNRDGTPMKKPPRPALPTDKVRFVGDPVAFVVAETPLQAKDAAEAVEVDIEPLPAVVRPEDAARPGAPPHPRRSAGQRRARLSLRRQRAGGGGFRPGRARDAAQARQQPRGRQRDGAARGDRRLRRSERTLHAACAVAGRVRLARQHGGDSQGRAQAGARPDRQCRRLVRHEVGAVFRNMSACCTPRARSAGR